MSDQILHFCTGILCFLSEESTRTVKFVGGDKTSEEILRISKRFNRTNTGVCIVLYSSTRNYFWSNYRGVLYKDNLDGIELLMDFKS
jgi:hypothetical protein